MIYADLHCDTLTEYADLRENDGQVSFSKLHAAGCRTMCFAAFVRMEKGDLFATAMVYADKLRREIARNADIAMPVLGASDMRRAAAENKVGAMLTVEEGAVVEGDIANVRRLHRAGVRMMTLTWNYANALGRPNATVDEYAARGERALYDVSDAPLTEFGRAVLAEMNAAGVLADVSHLSDGGFWDVVRLSTKPVVASHSNARAVRGVGRNLTDAQIAALSAKGGVMGLNLCPDFLCAKDADVLEWAVRHAVHIWQTGGEDVLAFGADFDGTKTRAPLADCTNTPLLYGALCDQMPPRVVDKMMWGNFLRVLEDACG